MRSASAIGIALWARIGWRLYEAIELTKLSKPLQRALVQPALRLLTVGDTTAVGTGATTSQASVAGLLGEHFPRLHIDNRSSDGAKFAGLVAHRARQRAAMLVLMPAGNVGNAPFFFAPVSWWMTWRSRQLHGFVNVAAARHDAVVAGLFRERADDPFVRRPELNAVDGLHPNDAGYRVWCGELMAQADLRQRLAAALAADR